MLNYNLVTLQLYPPKPPNYIRTYHTRINKIKKKAEETATNIIDIYNYLVLRCFYQQKFISLRKQYDWSLKEIRQTLSQNDFLIRTPDKFYRISFPNFTEDIHQNGQNFSEDPLFQQLKANFLPPCSSRHAPQPSQLIYYAEHPNAIYRRPKELLPGCRSTIMFSYLENVTDIYRIYIFLFFYSDFICGPFFSSAFIVFPYFSYNDRERKRKKVIVKESNKRWSFSVYRILEFSRLRCVIFIFLAFN